MFFFSRSAGLPDAVTIGIKISGQALLPHPNSRFSGQALSFRRGSLSSGRFGNLGSFRLETGGGLGDPGPIGIKISGLALDRLKAGHSEIVIEDLALYWAGSKIW